ncbi:MAG: TonB-dependent receptor [Balneolaceae bacterium]|jgi:hypothetical protein
MKRYTSILFAFLMFPMMVFAQHSIKGSIKEADTGEVLPGANVVIVGTSKGASADADGQYEIGNLENGTYTLRATMVGFAAVKKIVTISGSDEVVNFELKMSNESLQALEVFASRAVERKTPVAYTDVDKEQIKSQLGSRDIPLVLNTTPSVYSTAQGGGAGDARVNVRGFNQRHVSIMLNGVPVNDMENGWVYWSNWDGVGDVATSIQVQRGLSAVNLATPSIGGTMNIITDPAAVDKGGMVKQELGSYGFQKTTAVLNTGLINDKFSFSAAGVRKTGDGYYDGSWTDAYAFYLGASYQVNDNNRLDLYAMGAPQRHGQNLYAQNLAAYSHSYARDLGYSQAALNAFPEAGRTYNENYNTVSSSYGGDQWKYGEKRQRYDNGFINERENFYYKPQVNLNWYSNLSDNLLLSTVAYYSGGKGGGTGTLGSIQWDYSGPSRVADWDATIAANRANGGESLGILRASRNNQWTIGAISKATLTTDNWKITGGVDWRTAQIDHYREVYDLLGGDYFMKTNDDFNPNQQIGLGDKVDYNYTNSVDWIGFFLQGEYSTDNYTAYGMAGYSGIKYGHKNYFTDGGNGKPLELHSDFISGYQVKGGFLYNLSEKVGLFANLGFVSKVPIFDNVINDFTFTKNDNPTNEKFYSYEVGSNIHLLDNRLNLKANLYYTIWNDQAYTITVRDANQNDRFVNVEGVNSLHSGFEFEVAYQPVHWFRFDGASSIGYWKYTNNVSATIQDFSAPGNQRTENIYTKDLRVGDAPQTQFSYGVTVIPIRDLSVQVVGKSFADYWSGFDPTTRTDPADEGVQSWKVPAYTIFELHASYNFSSVLQGTKFFLNVFNLTDKLYIQDATDNSPYNAFSGNGVNHSVDDAEVFLGMPRTINLGVSVNF